MTDKYIYTNKSTPDTIQQCVDDANYFIGDVIKAAGFYDVTTVDGVEGIEGKSNGKSRPDAQRTITYDVVKEKVGATGFYVLNPIWFMENRKTVVNGQLVPTFDPSTIGLCPNPDDYTGLYFTDDISEWLPVYEELDA